MQLVKNLCSSATRAVLQAEDRGGRDRPAGSEAAHRELWDPAGGYLNTVPYGTLDGQTAEGVGIAASWVFFDHAAIHDTLAQSALLAGLPQAPTDYNPFLHPQAAYTGATRCSEKMAQQGYISGVRGARRRACAAWSAPQRPLRQLPRQLPARLHSHRARSTTTARATARRAG